MRASPSLLAADSSHRGSVMIEFALVLPVFLLIGWGVAEFGQALYTGRLLSDQARRAAHQTLDGVAAEQVKQDVRDTLGTSLDAPAAAIEVAIQRGHAASPVPFAGEDTATSREAVDVRIRLDYDEVSWVVGGFLNGTDLEGRCLLLR